MPAAVKSKEDEANWTASREQVAQEYPDVTVDSPRYWKLCMEIFRRRKFHTGGKPAPAPAAKAHLAWPTSPRQGILRRTFARWFTKAGATDRFHEAAAHNSAMLAKAEIKEPGKRGGKFWYDKGGRVQYGEPPADAKHFGSRAEFEKVHQGHTAEAHVELGNRHITEARGDRSGAVMHEHLATAHFEQAEKKGRRLKFSPTADRYEVISGSHPGTQGPAFSYANVDHVADAAEEAERRPSPTAKESREKQTAGKHHVIESKDGYLQHRQFQAMRDNAGNRADLKRWHEQHGETVEFKEPAKPVAKALPMVTCDATGHLVVKARAFLSERKREQIGRPGDQKREDMPDHVFLLPDKKLYPVKLKKDGKWVFDLSLLEAAAKRARVLGHEDLARRADAIRERLEGGVKGEAA